MTGKREDSAMGCGTFTGRGERVEIRRFTPADAVETSWMIAAALCETNSADYPESEIREMLELYSVSGVLRRGEESHMYVACGEAGILGCGAIGAYEGREDESILLTIFVLPAFQKRGIGRRIMETLEADEYFLRAARVEVHSSITAHGFYRDMGYRYINGGSAPDAEGCVPMEKRRSPGAAQKVREVL